MLFKLGKNIKLMSCPFLVELVVSGSKYDRLHFKHKPGHSYCILSDERLTLQEHKQFTEILRRKESFKHKKLKGKLQKQKKRNCRELGNLLFSF